MPSTSEDVIKMPRVAFCPHNEWDMSAICVHLIDGETNEWFEDPQPADEDEDGNKDGYNGRMSDWRCRACHHDPKKGEYEWICMDCRRLLSLRHGAKIANPEVRTRRSRPGL
jgi:hypothetical protein